MGLFHRPTVPMGETSHSFVSVIQNEGNNAARDIIAWRHPESNFNTHSKLIVGPNEEAIFENGAYIEGVFPERTECNLDTQNLFLIRNLREALSGGSSFFPCKVIFVSTKPFNIDWYADTPLRYNCPELGRGTQLKGGGTYTVRVTDSGLFRKEVLADAEAYTSDDLKLFLNDRCYKYISKTIIKYLEDNNLSSFDLETYHEDISDLCKPKILELIGCYGLSLIDFTIDMSLDEETAERYENEVRQRKLEGKGKVEGMNEMGDNYTRIEGMEILKNISLNPGAGGIAAAGAGLGMGMAAGNVIGSIASSVFNAPNPQQTQQPVNNRYGTGDRFGTATQQGTSTASVIPQKQSREEKLRELKSYLDQGFISQEDYMNTVKDILNEIKNS